MKHDKIVCVEWEDATYSSGYFDKINPLGGTFTRTVGHLVRKTKEGITVSQDRFYRDNGEADDDRHLSFTPRKMIKRIIYLKEV